jgi:hypothetical protein
MQESHVPEEGSTTETLTSHTPSRRHVLHLVGIIAVYIPLPASAVVSTEGQTQTVFRAGQPVALATAQDRFRQARHALHILDRDFTTIVQQGGGDGIRRALGFVGTTSPLYGVPKILNVLRDAANDPMAIAELETECLTAWRAADTAAYSSNFVEYSAAKTKPEQFWADAQREIQLMIQYMDQLAIELQLE